MKKTWTREGATSEARRKARAYGRNYYVCESIMGRRWAMPRWAAVTEAEYRRCDDLLPCVAIVRPADDDSAPEVIEVWG